MKLIIENANIVTPNEVMLGDIAIENGLITEISKSKLQGDTFLDGKGKYLLAGFVDLHCHGGINFDFMDADAKQMKQIADFHLSHGTTSMLATTLASPGALYSVWQNFAGSILAYVFRRYA